MNARRREGEIIRDSVLAVSGRLDDKMFGKSVQNLITPFMDGRNRPKSGPVDGEGRRSIYLTVLRNYLSPMMTAFDTPVPDSTLGRRTVSNVPAQSLVMMNHEFFAEQAERWGKRVLENGDLEPGDRIERIFLTALGRAPTEGELENSLKFLTAQGVLYELSESEAQSDPRVWADFCHVIFMLKEFIFVA